MNRNEHIRCADHWLERSGAYVSTETKGKYAVLATAHALTALAMTQAGIDEPPERPARPTA